MSDDRLLGELLSDTRALVRQLLDEPPCSPEALREQLRVYGDRVRDDLDPRSLADKAVGLELVERAEALLADWAGFDHRGRRLVQVAVRYLVLEDDGDDDLGSPFGFDDDREVMDAVSRALGR